LTFDDPGFFGYNVVNGRGPSAFLLPAQTSLSIGLSRSYAGTAYYQYQIPVISHPFTLMSWGIANSISTSGETIISLNCSSANRRANLYTNYASLTFYCVNDAIGASATATIAANTQYQICAVNASATSRIIYLNGVPGTENTTSVSLASSGLDLIAIGRNSKTSPDGYWNGTIGLARVWRRALSQSEIIELRDNPWQLYLNETGAVTFIPTTTGIKVPVAYHHRQTQGLAA
jgi:hypothetical protein